MLEYTNLSVFLISSYGTHLTQRGSYLALHNSLFGLGGTENYDYIVTKSINFLLMAQDVFPMVHTLPIFEPIWSMLQNVYQKLCQIYIKCICSQDVNHDYNYCLYYYLLGHSLQYSVSYPDWSIMATS